MHHKRPHLKSQVDEDVIDDIFFFFSLRNSIAFFNTSFLLCSVFSWTFPGCFLSESPSWVLNNYRKILSSAQPN